MACEIEARPPSPVKSLDAKRLGKRRVNPIQDGVLS